MAIINCGNTYTQDISGCLTSIVFDLGLTAETEHTLQFSFANGFKVRSNITTDVDGKFTLERNSFLAGFWNEATGEILFEVFERNSYNIVPYTICAVVYSQITINFTKIITDESIGYIPSPCTE